MKFVRPIFLALALIAPGAGTFGATLDQSYLVTDRQDSLVIFSTTDAYFQTFTVGTTGFLDQINLEIRRVDSPSSPLTFELRATTATNTPDLTPAGLLYTTTAAPDTIPNHDYPYPLTSFAIPSLPVVAGQKYTIGLRYPDAPTAANAYAWAAVAQGTGTSYAGGDLYRNGTNVTYDAGFQTFVSVPEPTTAGAIALASGVFIRRRRRTASHG